MTIPPDDVYITPSTQVLYGEVIKVDGNCYIKTGRKKGTMTNFMDETSLSSVSEIIDGVCDCDTGSTTQRINEASTISTENYVYLSPSDIIPIGAVIKYEGTCYVKTGKKGTMDQYIETPTVFSETCEDCETSSSS